MGDISIFDLTLNPSLIKVLKNDVIMVGLNISRSSFLETVVEPFRNFHDSSPWAHDFKIRYAFYGTDYYGAYMTDIIKDFPMIHSNHVTEHLRAHPELVAANVQKFREELQHVGSAPMLLAFGASVYNIIKRNLEGNKYSRLVKLTHYSHRISKDDYRDKVLNQIQASC
jgi:hypothetical protein